MNSPVQARETLIHCWNAGVESVRGEYAVREAIKADGVSGITHILAVGKAASSMCLGALPELTRNGKVLLITKHGYVDRNLFDSPNIEIYESGHPVPDQNSLLAGQRALEFVQSIPAAENLVMLVSGGASALIECLPENIDLDTLKWVNEKLLADGYSIDQINSMRMQLSKIKGGKLLGNFTGNSIQVYAISDVPGDSISFIGSGIGSTEKPVFPDFEVPADIQPLLDENVIGKAIRNDSLENRYGVTIVASNEIARNAVQAYAEQTGYKVVENMCSLNDDIENVSKVISGTLLDGPKGIYIWGGEPTVILPACPGVGGRNQSLALTIARAISGRDDINVIAAGTDGSDGPTEAAGGVVDGKTFMSVSGGEKALLEANAGSFLKKAGALFVSGPTGTNVMDLVIGLKC